MKKALISIGLYCSILFSTVAQKQEDNYEIMLKKDIENALKKEEKEKNTVGFKTLKIEEVNFISSYYNQTGNHSPVTGGVGTEKLFDVANSIDIKLSFKDFKKRSHYLNIDGAVDFYSSASSDMIDPRSRSSASMRDTHVYPSINWSVKNEVKKTSLGAGVAYSTEYDYKSIGGNLNFSKTSKDNNTEFSAKIGSFFDKWMVILPYELRPKGYPSGSRGDNQGLDFKRRNSYNLSLSVSQVINKSLQMTVTAEPSRQEGLLSTPFHRIYFTDNTLKVEKLPGQRTKLPVSVRANYFLGDKIIFRSFYRYYFDDWGMKAHTVSIETTYKLTSFLSVTPHYRFNSQTAVKYFNGYKQHKLSENYYTSDFDISGFNSSFFGAGIRFAPPGGIFGIRSWNTVEIRYGHYNRTNGLAANSISMAMKFK
jgi:Protein of unknown function (DUF3570)